MKVIMSYDNPPHEILVDDDVYVWASKYKWYTKPDKGISPHRALNNHGMSRLSREIMNCPDNMLVDHKYHNVLDNRRESLRICTRAENNRNARSRRNTGSKYKGVSWHKRRNKWIAIITTDRKRLWLGYFDNEAEAARTYNLAATKLHGEYALLNQI